MKIIRPMSPLRRRMCEDMQIRNYSPHTIDGYLRYVAQFGVPGVTGVMPCSA